LFVGGGVSVGVARDVSGEDDDPGFAGFGKLGSGLLEQGAAVDDLAAGPVEEVLEGGDASPTMLGCFWGRIFTPVRLAGRRADA
jgi:hypothetical protein